VTDMFPPGIPVVNPGVPGSQSATLTIEQWLQNPLRVQRTIADLTQERFIADRIFAKGGTATGGAVIYDQVLGSDLFADRDVQAIEPGSEFPLVVTGETAPLVARTIKWGGAAKITYEERDRDKRDVLNRKLTRLRNTIVRKVDTVAVASLYAAPILTSAAATVWTDPTAPIFDDVATAKTTSEVLDLGYELDSALINYTTALAILKNKDLRDSLPRENQGSPNPVLIGKLSGIAGITNWYATNRMPEQDVLLLAGQTAGSISDEKPLYSRVFDWPLQEAVYVMAARLVVPYVTDPKSVVRITGVQA
jgi:hypothetical protein